MVYLNGSHSPLNMILPQVVYVSCSIKAEPKALPYIGVLSSSSCSRPEILLFQIVT